LFLVSLCPDSPLETKLKLLHAAQNIPDTSHESNMKLMINDKTALVPQYHFLKACGGMEVNGHLFSTLAAERATHSGHFTPQKILGYKLDMPLGRIHSWCRYDGREKYPHPFLKLNLRHLTLYYSLLGA
jgi:hypothetical protein